MKFFMVLNISSNLNNDISTFSTRQPSRPLKIIIFYYFYFGITVKKTMQDFVKLHFQEKIDFILPLKSTNLRYKKKSS